MPDALTVPPFTSASNRVRDIRRPARSRWALRFSAAILGSSLTAVAFIRSMVPVSSGAVKVPLDGQFQRRVALDADLVGEDGEGSDVERAVDVEIQRALSHQADAAAGHDRSRRAGQVELARPIAVPDAMVIVAGCCCARVRPANVTFSSSNEMCPSSAVEIGAGCGEVGLGADSSAELGGHVREGRGVESAEDGLERCGAALARDCTGSRGTTSSGTRPDTCSVAVPQFASSCSMSAAPFSTRARRTMFEKPGCSCGERSSPLSTVRVRSGSMRSSVPRSDPFKVTAPSPEMFVSGGAYCVKVASVPRRSTAISPGCRLIREWQVAADGQRGIGAFDC